MYMPSVFAANSVNYYCLQLLCISFGTSLSSVRLLDFGLRGVNFRFPEFLLPKSSLIKLLSLWFQLNVVGYLQNIFPADSYVYQRKELWLETIKMEIDFWSPFLIS